MKLKGIEKALIEEVKDEMNVESALSEFIDSGFDYANTRIDIILDEKNNYIKCMNDGIPMKEINKYVDYFHAHIQQNSERKNLISTFGKGTKKAFLKLGDAKLGSTLNVYAKDKDYENFIEHASISMKFEKYDDCFNVKHIDIEKTRDNSIIPYTQGTCMEIQNLDNCVWAAIHGVNENGEIRNDYYKIIKFCKERYALIAKKNNIDLYINSNKIIFEDPCYIINLGDKIKKDGCYVVNGICYWVHTYKPINIKTEEKVKFKMVYTFIPRITMSEIQNDKGYEMLSGYYTYYGNRLMDNGGNYRTFLGGFKGSSVLTTGGCDRIRIAIFTDKNEKFFKITSTKSNGIEPFQNNENFSNFKINRYSMYTILKEDLLSFIRLNVEDRKDKNDSKPKHIDFNLLKECSQTLSDTKKKIKVENFSKKKKENVINEGIENKAPVNIDDVISAPIEDDLAKKIDSFTIPSLELPYLTQMVKDLLYSVLNTSQLKKRATSEEFINNALKEIEKYEKRTISTTEAA